MEYFFKRNQKPKLIWRYELELIYPSSFPIALTILNVITLVPFDVFDHRQYRNELFLFIRRRQYNYLNVYDAF